MKLEMHDSVLLETEHMNLNVTKREKNKVQKGVYKSYLIKIDLQST